MTVDSVLYESHVAFEFARNWGRLECSQQLPKNKYAELLGNSQNPFDEIFGDLVGRAGVRYFIIEFKRVREGFAKEVSTNSDGKFDRIKLYDHLKSDQDCRELSRRGHYAAYLDFSKDIALEPYAFAAGQLDKSATYGKELPSIHEMDYRPDSMSELQFFDEVCNRENSIDITNKLYKSGIGLSEDRFFDYVECMYKHLKEDSSGSGKNGIAIAAAIDAVSGKTRMTCERIEVLLIRLSLCLHELRAKAKKSSKSGLSSGRK